MKTYKTLLLLIISIITVYTGWAFLAWNTINSTFLNTNYYQEVIEETGIIDLAYREYQELLPEIIIESLEPSLETSVDLEDETLPEELIEEELKRQEMLNLIETEVLTRLEVVVISLARSFEPEWLRTHTLEVIKDVIALVKGEKSELETTIELRSNKQNLRRELVNELNLVVEIEDSQEDGEPDQIALMASFIVEQLNIPDTINLNELYKSDTVPTEINAAIAALQKVDTALLYWPYIILAGLLVLSIIIAGPTAGLKWNGLSYILFSLTFMLGLQLINTIFSAQLIGVSEVLIAEIPVPRNLIIDSIGLTTSYSTNTPFIFLAIGTMLLLSGFIYKAVAGKE